MTITFWGFGGSCITTLGWGCPAESGIVQVPQCIIDLQSPVDLVANLDSEVDQRASMESLVDTVVSMDSEVETRVSMDSAIDLVVDLESEPC